MDKEFNVTEYFELLNWNELKRSYNKIYYVDIENRYNQSNDITENYEREELMKVDSFISNSSNERTTIGSINHYTILDRIIDNNNNLFLFTISKHYQIQR
jgi:hypothetical protein